MFDPDRPYGFIVLRPPAVVPEPTTVREVVDRELTIRASCPKCGSITVYFAVSLCRYLERFPNLSIAALRRHAYCPQHDCRHKPKVVTVEHQPTYGSGPGTIRQ